MTPELIVLVIVLVILVVVRGPGVMKWLNGTDEAGTSSVPSWGAGVGPPLGQAGSVIRGDRLPPVLTRIYHGKPREAALLQQVDAEPLAERGYYPTSQSYTEGRWSGGAWVLAVLACFILIGILIFIYMIVDKPAGDLTVIYERKIAPQPAAAPPVTAASPVSPSPAPSYIPQAAASDAPTQADAMKKCPDCAEQVRTEARICRYCRYEFPPSPVVELPLAAVVPLAGIPLARAISERAPAAQTVGIYGRWRVETSTVQDIGEQTVVDLSTDMAGLALATPERMVSLPGCSVWPANVASWAGLVVPVLNISTGVGDLVLQPLDGQDPDEIYDSLIKSSAR